MKSELEGRDGQISRLIDLQSSCLQVDVVSALSST